MDKQRRKAALKRWKASWIPVYCWIVPGHRAWYLEGRTESNRYTQDLPKIAALISFLAR
jgi:hypothetical protein